MLFSKFEALSTCGTKSQGEDMLGLAKATPTHGSTRTKTYLLKADLETLCLSLDFSSARPRCVTTDKLVNVSGLLSPHLSDGGDNSIHCL